MFQRLTTWWYTSRLLSNRAEDRCKRALSDPNLCYAHEEEFKRVAKEASTARCVAAWRLRRIGTPEATRALVVALMSSDFPAEVRGAAADALIELNWEPVSDEHRQALAQFRKPPPESHVQRLLRIMVGAGFESWKDMAFQVAATGDLSAIDELNDYKNAPRPIERYYGDDHHMETNNERSIERQENAVRRIREETVRELLQNATTESLVQLLQSGNQWSSSLARAELERRGWVPPIAVPKPE